MIFPHSTQVHLWFVKLKEDLYQTENQRLLNAEEIKRAGKFKFELHRKRFITARAGLRSILSLYLDMNPQQIEILTTFQGKPYLKPQLLQFNVSHAHDLALYAFTLSSPVGVDIEKIRRTYSEAVAKRFFSTEEYEAFSKLPEDQKRFYFFRIWTCKEALIKAVGEGLRLPLSSFSIPLEDDKKEIILHNETLPQTWYLERLDLFPGYQAAFVTHQAMTHLSYFEWTAAGEKEWREASLLNLA